MYGLNEIKKMNAEAIKKARKAKEKARKEAEKALKRRGETP